MRQILYILTLWIPCSFACGQGVVYGKELQRDYERATYRESDEFGDKTAVFGKNNIALSLLPLFRSGFEVSYDRKIINQHWVKISPIYYHSQDYTPSTENNLKVVNGYGVKLHHKYFPYNHVPSSLGVFLDYGPAIQHFKITTKSEEHTQFNKYGFDCAVGIHKIFGNVFYIEGYCGLAAYYLKGSDNRNAAWRDVLKEQDKMWFDYGKTGNYFFIGVNLGILF